MEKSVDEFITRGYRITDQGETSTRLKDNHWGDADAHLVVAALTIWWTFGLANAIYAIYKRVTAEEIIVKVDEATVDEH